MDGGVSADGDNAREDNQGAADGSGLGAAVDPALVANGDGGAASEEVSVEGAAKGADGIASAVGGGSTVAGMGQGAAVAGDSTAGVAKDSGQGTVRPVSASASDQGTTRLSSATWPCPDRATRKMELTKKDQNGPKVPFDSPAMGTRSKKSYLASPAMSTRSKRRLGS
uniref:Uncharacterized protein n=1 Tax=Aegilops tauschii subsp. strangulata TaxID=200361 RepID=A0A453LK67_AEGTS